MGNSKAANKRLVTGTIVYMIGNITSKIFQMLILPIVTVSLSASEYGYYDLIITTISLVTPLVTFQMIEGMFRYMFHSSDEEKKNTVSTVTALLLCSFLVLGIAVFVVNTVTSKLEYPGLIYLNYVSAIIFNYMQKMARCQQKNRQFAVAGVINTIVMLGIQAITLLAFKMGIDGMLLANCVSYLVASAYLGLYLRIRQWLDYRKISKKTLKELICYSAPLIPNSIGWWLIASSDKYVIAFFLDTASNGIYSIAGKFSQLLTFVTNVFQLAWQESAIMEANSDERDKFYTQIFNSYMKLLMGGYLVVLPFIKIIIPILLEESYRIGYLYNPMLLLGAVFSAFSQFYGSAYLVFKRTKGAFYTTLIAALINLFVGVGLIKWLGLFAPALGTTTAFFVQWMIRAYQLKDCFHVIIEKKSLAFLSLAMLVATIAYYSNSVGVQIVFTFIGLSVFLLVNKDAFVHVIKKLRRKS